MPKSVGGYDLGPTIGVGALGKIKVATTEYLNPNFAIPAGQRAANSGGGTANSVRFAVRQVDRSALRVEERVAHGAEERLRRAIASLTRLQHPHILGLFEVVRTRGGAYFVSELAAGPPISLPERVLTHGPLHEPEAREIFHRVACAVFFAHGNKIAHRNVKPSNVLFVPTTTFAARGRSGTAGGGASSSPSSSFVAAAPSTTAPPSLATHSIKLSNFGMALLLRPPPHPIVTAALEAEAKKEASSSAPQQHPHFPSHALNDQPNPTNTTNTTASGTAAAAPQPQPSQTVSHAAIAAEANAQRARQQHLAALEASFAHPFFCPPEALRDPQYDAYAADVWGLGVLLYFSLSGALPFEAPTLESLLPNLNNGDFRMPRGLTDGAKRLLARMLTVDPRRRITMEEVVADAWFQIDFNPALLDLGAFEPREPPIVADHFAASQLRRQRLALAAGLSAHHTHPHSNPISSPLHDDGGGRSAAAPSAENGSFGVGGDSFFSSSFASREENLGGGLGIFNKNRQTLVGFDHLRNGGGGGASPSVGAAGVTSTYRHNTLAPHSSDAAAGSLASAASTASVPHSALVGADGGGGWGGPPSPQKRRQTAATASASAYLRGGREEAAGAEHRNSPFAAYLSLAPPPLDAFGLILRMLATNFNDLRIAPHNDGAASGGLHCRRGQQDASELISSTLGLHPLRLYSRTVRSPLLHGGGGGEALCEAPTPAQLLRDSPMLHGTLRRTLLIANTAASAGGHTAVDGGHSHSRGHHGSRIGGGAASASAGPLPLSTTAHAQGGGGGGPLQGVMTALQTLQCSPQPSADGGRDITGFFLGGRQGQLNIRVRVTPTVVTTLFLVVVMAERGGVADFAAFVAQFQQALGPAVVSVQRDPAEVMEEDALL